MKSYFMADSELTQITLDCGETLEVMDSISAAKLAEINSAHGDDREATSRAMLEFVVKGWSFKNPDGSPKELTIDNIYDLKLGIFLDIVSKVMAALDLPLDSKTFPTALS